MITADVIVGGFFGDEGKGKYVGRAGREYDVVLRVNASTNAGHRVVDDEHERVTRQLPSVFFPDRTQLVIAPGALLNPVALAAELAARPDQEQLRAKLLVASSVSLVIRPYIKKGQGPLSKLIGSTHQGTGPSAVARAARHSLHLYDLQAVSTGGAAERSRVVDKLARTCSETLPLEFAGPAEDHGRYFDEVLDELVAAYDDIAARVGPFCIDYSSFMAERRTGPPTRMLIEGCNGLLLDNLHGAHPHVTSTSTNIGALICGANLSPQSIDRVVVVCAAYCTCLGPRPFPTEMSDEEAGRIYAQCQEIDPAEDKRRRLGWFDLPGYRKSLSGCQGAVLHLNKLDVLSGLERIKVCTHYRSGGQDITIMPDDPAAYRDAVAQTIEVEGWQQPLGDIRTFDELPQAAQRYVALLNEHLPNEIVSVGVGPRNDDVIDLPHRD